MKAGCSMYQADYTAIISPFLPAGAYVLEITEPAMRKAVLAADFDGDHALAWQPPTDSKTMIMCSY